MTEPEIILGYSPYNTPSGNRHILYPFEDIWDSGKNLMQATYEDIKKCHALVLWGGQDISPMLYNETPFSYSGPAYPSQRDLFEWELCKVFAKEGKPIIGVCRGAQLLCAFAGGKLVQHTTGHNHDHEITTVENFKFTVSSSHHQMLYPYDVNHELLAWSTQHRSAVYQPIETEYCKKLSNKEVKEPEVVFFNDINALAVQCHPEWHGDKDPFNEWLFNVILERFFE